MAIKEFPNVSPDANATFGLEENTTEFNSVLTKTAQHMTLPGAKWRGSVSFTNRSRQEANKVKAFKAALGGKAGRFYLTPFDAYQNGTMAGAGVIDGEVASGVGSLPTNGWAADQDTLFEAGDYLEVNGELKMVVGDVAAPQSYIEYAGNNHMPSPFDPSGWFGATSDPDGTIINSTLQNPSGSTSLGEYTQVNESIFLMCQSGAASVEVGEKVFAAILIKQIDTPRIRFRFYDSQGFLDNVFYDIDSNEFQDGDGRSTSVGDDYYLIEVPLIASRSDTGIGVQIYPWPESGSPNSFPPVGSQLYVQAAYFGESDDWPAQLLATADIPIAPPLRKALAGGEAITTTDPKGIFSLGSDSQEWSINVNGVQDMGFDFIEDIN